MSQSMITDPKSTIKENRRSNRESPARNDTEDSYLLFEVQSGLHGLQTGSPFVLIRLLDILEDDTSSALVLKLHEFLSVIRLFRR